ncbi:hypothetical protein PsYK624_148540 [Phanerochaete sordida]|uniref:F-box domain-containing protein n=1 Tax=Phanerochaete sordida TaxID=48140 RepID=A0A9P3LKR5_9APHY|nr:hypothetical protein PsYK624_148540 [Phanerochaete sordida]
MSTDSSVASLPLEIFVDIFGHAARDAHDAYIRSLKHEALPTDPERACPYSWIRLTHVCRVWRWIALTAPALWSDVSIIDADATDEIVARTNGRNITVTFRLPKSGEDDLPWEQIDNRMDVYALLIQDDIHRITALTVPAMLELFIAPSVANAKQLRSITMLAPSIGNGAPGPAPFAFPALEHLEYRCPGHFSPVRMFSPTLRSLVVQPLWEDVSVPRDPVRLLTAPELVRALARMPLLESLDVRLRDASEDEQVQTVAASRLRRVRLMGNTTACAYILKHVALPRDVQLAVECLADQVRNADVTVPVLHALATTLVANGNAPVAPCHALSIEADAEPFVFRGWRSADPAGVRGEPDISLLCLREGRSADFEALLRPFTVRAVQQIRIARVPRDLFGTSVGLSAVVRGKNLRHLVLDGAEAVHALEVLVSTTATDVTLADINFKPSEPAEAERWLDAWAITDTPVSPDEPSSIADLAELLLNRAAEGRSLRRLEIVGAKNVKADGIENVRKHVGELRWDGAEVVHLRPA